MKLVTCVRCFAVFEDDDQHECGKLSAKETNGIIELDESDWEKLIDILNCVVAFGFDESDRDFTTELDDAATLHSLIFEALKSQ